MRDFYLMAGAIIGAVAFGSALPAEAVSIQGSICRDYAHAAADYVAQGSLQPAGDFETADSGAVLVIAAGRKYIMPARQDDERSLAPMPVGERIAAYETVKAEEFNHCMFGLAVNAETLK